MKTIRVFLSETFQFLEVKFSIYLNRRVFVMRGKNKDKTNVTYKFTDARTKITVSKKDYSDTVHTEVLYLINRKASR